MTKLQKLKNLNLKILAAVKEAEKLTTGMNDKQKETWKVSVTCFIKQASTNVETLMTKVREKAKAA